MVTLRQLPRSKVIDFSSTVTDHSDFPTIRYLLELRARIGYRLCIKYKKEIVSASILLIVLETASAGGLLQTALLLLFTLTLVALIALHWRRRDGTLLRTVLRSPGKYVLLESAMISLPALLVLILAQRWMEALVLVVVPTILTFVTWRPTTGALKLPTVLSPITFEWSAGLRQRIVGLALLYGLCIAFNASGVILIVGLIVLPMTLASVYGPCESHLMLTAVAKDRKTFLRRKIVVGLRLYILFALPLLALASWRMPDKPLLILIPVALGILFMTGSILSKYAYFEQGKSSEMEHGLRVTILLSTILLLPFTFVYQWYLYRRALRLLPALDSHN